MTSIKCPSCKLVNWSTDAACKRCGSQLAFNTSPSHSNDSRQFSSGNANQPYVNAEWNTQPNHTHQNFGSAAVLKTGLAISSMVLGIVSLPTSFLLIGVLLAPIALVLGIVAIVKAGKKPFEYGGKGFAIAGIATSSTALLLIVPIIAAIAIPNLLAARRAANEGSAISGLRTLHAAQMAYMSVHKTQVCGDLRSLGSADMIDPVMASGTKNGYQYDIAVSSEGFGCDVFATPINKSEGTRSFMISRDGVTRGAKKQGLPATKNDPQLN